MVQCAPQRWPRGHDTYKLCAGEAARGGAATSPSGHSHGRSSQPAQGRRQAQEHAVSRGGRGGEKYIIMGLDMQLYVRVHVLVHVLVHVR